MDILNNQGEQNKFSRNPYPFPFNIKKHKIDMDQRRILEEKRNAMSKTQGFYISSRKTKNLKKFSGKILLEKKISIMERVPKNKNKTLLTENNMHKSDFSTLVSTLKNKQGSSKAEIRAKLNLLRSQSAERNQRRCLNFSSTIHYPFGCIPNK